MALAQRDAAGIQDVEIAQINPDEFTGHFMQRSGAKGLACQGSHSLGPAGLVEGFVFKTPQKNAMICEGSSDPGRISGSIWQCGAGGPRDSDESTRLFQGLLGRLELHERLEEGDQICEVELEAFAAEALQRLETEHSCQGAGSRGETRPRVEHSHDCLALC